MIRQNVHLEKDAPGQHHAAKALSKEHKYNIIGVIAKSPPVKQVSIHSVPLMLVPTVILTLGRSCVGSLPCSRAGSGPKVAASEGLAIAAPSPDYAGCVTKSALLRKHQKQTTCFS